MSSNKNLNLSLKICFLIVLEAIVCFTPIGSIPIGPIVATISMVPVIITSLTFGVKYGIVLGFVTGLYSFIYWTFLNPSFPTAFLFSPFSESAGYEGNIGSIIICFIPRILTGLTPALITKIFNKNKILSDIFGSIVGSFTNTFLVLFFIFIFFSKEYTSISNNSLIYILSSTIITNGIPEAIICAIVCPSVTRVLKNI